jgi:hypothetical protein
VLFAKLAAQLTLIVDLMITSEFMPAFSKTKLWLFFFFFFECLNYLNFVYHALTIFCVLLSMSIDFLNTDAHLDTHTHTCIYICFHILKLLIDSTYIELTGIKNVNQYTYKELRVATNDFSPASKIGEGGFGSVYKVLAYCIRCHPYSLRNTDHHHFIMLKRWF